MAAYIDMKPHMDVVTHHTTTAGDFAMTRSQWLIRGGDADGRPVEVHHHGMEVHRSCRTAPGPSSSTIPAVADPTGRPAPRETGDRASVCLLPMRVRHRELEAGFFGMEVDVPA